MSQIRPMRRLTDVLPLLSRGRFVEKCDEHMAHALETLAALPEGKGVAQITITLSIAYDTERVEIKPTVKSKLPEEKGFSGTPFWTVDNGISTQHPSQFDLPGLREVPERTRAEG